MSSRSDVVARRSCSRVIGSNGGGSRCWIRGVSQAHPAELRCRSPILRGDSFGQRSGPQATFALACRSVGAGVRPGVGRVVRASEAIVVKATANEVPPTAEVLAAGMCHGTCVKAISAAFAKSSNPTGAKATHVSSTEAADVASAKATHVTSSTEAAHTAAVSAATSTSTSGFCARGNQAAGQ
jgi:hypothetical protein